MAGTRPCAAVSYFGTVAEGLEEVSEFGVWVAVLVALWTAADQLSAAGEFDAWRDQDGMKHTVILLLALMLIRTLSIGGDRGLRFALARRQSRAFVEEVRKTGAWQAQEMAAACSSYSQSHLASVVGSAVAAFLTSPIWCSQAEIVEQGKRAMTRAIRTTRADLLYGLATLAQIASVAPLIGLFGTVLGILQAFGPVAMERSSALGLTAHYLSDALLTTAAGLLVAIPSAWLFHWHRESVSNLELEMENACSEMVGYLRRQQHRNYEQAEASQTQLTFSRAAKKQGLRPWEIAADSQIFFLLPIWLPLLYCVYVLVRAF